MHQKENLSARHRHNKEGLMVTADVTDALKVLNNNGNWKNVSSKFNKTINPKTINPSKVMNNIMTEEDIDRLFNRSKEKIKTEVIGNTHDDWGNTTHKDFANSVKFLKIDDESDRLLTGLPTHPDLDDDRIQALFEDKKNDLTAEFKKNYLVGKVVGEGAYASVRVAIYKPLNKKIAIKVYEKGKIREPQRKKSVRREIKILQQLNHSNIVKIYDVVQTNHHLNIIMEYLCGISLNCYLKCQPGNKATEKNCRKIIKPLAEALKYLHDKSISHRDIKLENVILDEHLQPKLIDFGFSTCIQPHKKVKIFCGTPSYMAPEIVQKREYKGEPADVWALGVLFYVTLTGLFPFKGSTDQQLYKKINSADYPKSQLAQCKQANDLIYRMLKINPDQRITASEILHHPWVRNQSNSFNKKTKRVESSADCKKRTTISSHKSREKEDLQLNGIRKLTETYKDNLKLELRMIHKSPAKLNNTCTQRKLAKEMPRGPRNENKIVTSSINCKKEMLGKTHSKVLDLLRVEMKRRQDNKSKGKTRRL